MWRALWVVAIGIGLLAACQQQAPEQGAGELEVVPDIEARRARFVRQVLEVDVSHLDEGDRRALGDLVEAARAMDEIFKLQAWRENPEMAARVAGLSGPSSEAARDYYRIMYGPWDRLEDFEPFIGSTPRPEGAGFYPPDLGEEELEAWIAAHPEDREALTSLYTVVVREGEGLVAVPYSEAYREHLERAAEALRSAAAATSNQSLRTFLELRAEALLSDDYYESDLAWMDLDSAIEVVIGPYETYEDTLNGYKAAFEAFVCVAQPEDSRRLEAYKGELPFLEKNLPIPDEHKNFDRGTESPIRVVDEVFTAGDCRAGVQTLAFNLPNDERVRQAKGCKKVMLKNMMAAKYEAILGPIAERVLPEGEAARLDFDAYFHFILFHELSHGLGPGVLEIDGRSTEVRLELKDLYSPIEEAKADVLSVYNLLALAERGKVNEEIVGDLPWTYTAGLFRSARFGTTEAHGLGVVIQANYLLENGAIQITDEGRFRPVPDRFGQVFRDLAHEILMVQATGSYDGAENLVERYGPLRPEMRRLLDSLDAIPVDVDPVYPLKGLD